MLGIIGGSGLYQIDGLRDTQWVAVQSPFGTPSDALLIGELAGERLCFLPRHGRGHRIPPSDINYRANIDVLKRAGVTDVLSLSAVGSLREDLAPGTFVVVDQFIDRTVSRERSFFGPGMVAHVPMADPVCPRLGAAVGEAALAAGLPVHRGGTYVVIEGPQFSTRAESMLYRQWGGDVIGMTNLPEARLAREAELCYATVAMVTDFDCWHPDQGEVTVDRVMAVMAANRAQARGLIAHVAPRLAQHPAQCPHHCDRALDSSIVTPADARDPSLVARLDAVAGRILGPEGRG